MSNTQGGNGEVPEGPLVAVADSAGARLRAETDQDAAAANAAAEGLMSAASVAMAAGHSLSEIAQAEARGKDAVRRSLRADALRLVERTGNRAREMQAEHHRAIARATRLGLPMREIAQSAGVTHATVRAISSRVAAQASEQQSVSEPPRDTVVEGPPEPVPDSPPEGAQEQQPGW